MKEAFIPLLALIIPIYWMWCTHVATNARIKLLKDINSFLNPEKRNSEMTMAIVYNAYEDSKKHFFLLEIIFFALFKVKNTNLKESVATYKEIPKAERTKMLEIVFKTILTNIKLAPITYFITSAVFLFFILIITLINSLSPKRIKKALSMAKERTIYAIYSF